MFFWILRRLSHFKIKTVSAGLAHWLIIKKHISFFLQLEQPSCTELLVYSFVETKITRIKEEGVFLVSRSKWIEWNQRKAFSIPGEIIGFASGSNEGVKKEDFMLIVSKMNLFHLYSKSSLFITLQRVAPWKRIRITESGKFLLDWIRNPAIFAVESGILGFGSPEHILRNPESFCQ